MCFIVCLPGDLYVHADLHGATSVVIKNPSGETSYIEQREFTPDGDNLVPKIWGEGLHIFRRYRTSQLTW